MMNAKQSVEISFAKIEDLPRILELQYLAYQSEAKLLNNPDIPPLKQTLSDLENEYSKGKILKAVDSDETIIGSVRFYLEANTVNVGKLMVHPDYQGNGIGTRLLLHIETFFSGQRLELFTSNQSIRNIALYEQLGYHKFSEKKISVELTFIYLEKLIP